MVKDKSESILIAGDVCINSLQWVTNAKGDMNLNYKLFPEVNEVLSPGGALFLARLIQLSIQEEIISYNFEDSKNYMHQGVLVSSIQLEKFIKSATKKRADKVYRVKKYLGYRLEGAEAPVIFPITETSKKIGLVIINDDNNGFNKSQSNWPSILNDSKSSTTIIYKANQLDETNDLWKRIKDNYLEHTILVMNAEDLRGRGVNISKGLSWEKTSLDFVWQMKNNPNLKTLRQCKHIIVLFGIEGAIYYNNDLNTNSHLYFITNKSEGEILSDNEGEMYGLTSCFVAGVAQAIWKNRETQSLQESIDEGIRRGILVAQNYYFNGFGDSSNLNNAPTFNIFKFEQEDSKRYERIQEVEINTDNISRYFDSWYIIKEKSSTNLADISFNIVKHGVESALSSIPIAQFGNMKTVDRAEIESYRGIKKLISEYISAKQVVRPLCIAVFGTPGSGKSYGITEVAKSIAPEVIEKLDFNVSQFGSITDLISSFHKTRDLALKDKIPLIFFDEFDSSKEDKLGWLKYFLAPMQDGLFREGDALHPIGKAIFVFAGGTASTYEEFCGEYIKDQIEKERFTREFKSAKGPDFISRLRGYVNILGPNQVSKQSDQLFIIRRAMLLRSLIERKVPHLIDDKKQALVDNEIVRALLKVPRFKHESRSMEAILDMSTLATAKKWEQSYLPSKEQLKLHVDETVFYHYMMKEEFYSEKMEKIAGLLYPFFYPVYQFYHANELNGTKQWEALESEEKSIVYKHMKLIPTILKKINYEVLVVEETKQVMEFSESEVSQLAKLQHRIWVTQNINESIIEDSVGSCKKNYCTISWDKISEQVKAEMAHYIKAWPSVFHACNILIESK